MIQTDLDRQELLADLRDFRNRFPKVRRTLRRAPVAPSAVPPPPESPAPAGNLEAYERRDGAWERLMADVREADAPSHDSADHS